MTRFPLIAAALLAALLLAGCQGAGDEDESTVEAELPALVAPTSTNDDEWKAYLGQVIGRNVDGITERTFNYYLPAGVDPAEPEGPYARMKTEISNTLLRTVLPGNMLTFSSPNSTLMADLVVAAFGTEGVQDIALRGSRVLFIGEAKDEARVREAALAVGAEFRFVEVRR